MNNLHRRGDVVRCGAGTIPSENVGSAAGNGKHLMLNSILLDLTSDRLSPRLIQCGVELGFRHAARVRGMSIVDTRRINELVKECESAAYAVFERARLDRAEALQSTAQARMAQACAAADLDFDVRCAEGDPVDLLTREASFHDLVITGCPVPSQAGDRTVQVRYSRELKELVLRGVQPLLVLRESKAGAGRVLMVDDGSPASARAIKSFLCQRLSSDAEIRLLAWGRTERQARERLRDLTGYVRTHHSEFETGLICGPLRTILASYAMKWEADLVVTGVVRRSLLRGMLCRDMVDDLLRRTEIGLYLSG